MHKEKQKIIIAVLIFVIAIAIGMSVFSNMKKKEAIAKEKAHQEFIAKETTKELESIVEIVENFGKDNRWIEVTETEGYTVSLEELETIEMPTTDYLVRESLKTEAGEIVTYKDDSGKERLKVEVEYYSAPKLSILIDDVGMNTSIADTFGEIDEEISFATIPFLPKSKEATIKLREMGYEVILHMPMAGSSDSLNSRTNGIILPTMSKEEIHDKFDAALEDVGEVDGYNNHMGSRFTADEGKMREILEYTKKKDMFYIDSNTAIKNMGYPVALELGVPTYYCSHFLDNSREPEDMEKEIKRSVVMAKDKGEILVIGHYHNGLAKAIKKMVPFIEEEGVRLVFASRLLEVNESN